jgi:membrane protease YdiL (CAAX protease family)
MNERQASVKEDRRKLIEAIVAYAVFCGIGLISRYIPGVFLIFLLFGIVFPLVWAKIANDWQSIGFTRRNLGLAIGWGLGAGLVLCLYTYLVFRGDEPLPPMWGLQILISFPIWLIILSPFQEFFFRGWLQPRFEVSLGKWWGLVVTSIAFALWHFFPQFEGTMTSTLPVSSLVGIVSVIGIGLLFGYVFQRTGNIVAPWLAHAVGGIGLVLIGRMVFLQYIP